MTDLKIEKYMIIIICQLIQLHRVRYNFLEKNVTNQSDLRKNRI